MFELDQIVRNNIKNLTPYSSARDEFKGDGKIFLDANENPFGRYNRYPDPYQIKLKQKLSEIKHIPVNQLFLGNGSDEAIDLIYRIFCEPRNDKALTFTPTYGMYQVSADVNNIELLTIPLNQEFQISLSDVTPLLLDENLKLIFICSPNNPTGNAIDKETIEYLLKHFNGIVIIDEAYADFNADVSWSTKIEEYPNLIVLQTLSKAWGLAGLRLGLAITNPLIIEYLNKVKPPYNINQASQEIVLSQLDTIRFEEEKEKLLDEKKKLKQALALLPFVKKIHPSDANFFFVEVNNAPKLYQDLIKEGIIIRNRHQLIDNHVRITIGSEKENQVLIDFLKNYQQ